jgi:selenocysteine-specific elongation factor
VSRGVMLTQVDGMQPTTLVDVFFQHLPDASRLLKHDSPIKFFSGTSETTGRVRLLDAEILAPGAKGWLQVRLDHPVPLVQGDRFILRYPSPGETIGGGVIVDPHPAKRWKRMSPPVIISLETRMQGTPAQRIAQAAEGGEPVKRGVLQKVTGFNDHDLDAALAAALDEKQLVKFSDGTFLAVTSYNAMMRRMNEIVAAYHTTHPLRAGMPREELRSRLGMKQATLNLLIDSQVHPEIISAGKLVRLASFEIQFTSQQQAQIEHLQRVMNEAPYTPPSFDEAAQMVGEDVLRALIDLDEIVQVQPDVIFTRPVYEEMVRGVLEIIDRDRVVTAKALRDHFNTSRKYAIGLLEYLDTLQITKRVGDDRVRGKNSPQ